MNVFDASQEPALIAILLAALVTYSLRFGGLMLADRLPKAGRFRSFMDALPGAILLSLVAPGIFSSGIWGGAGAFCTAYLTWRTRNVFLAMLCGVAIVAVGRQSGM